MANKNELIEVDLFADHPENYHSKHKKHKKNKKKKIVEYDTTEPVDVVGGDGGNGGGSDASSSQIVQNLIDDSLPTTPTPTEMSAAEKLKNQTNAKVGKNQKKKKGRGKDQQSGTSSEEERWLDAIESGKLEQVDDELKKIKDPKLMTARQRAMYERGTDKEPTNSCGGNGGGGNGTSSTGAGGAEILMSLPTGYKEKVMTAEAIQKAQIKSQKRKQLADEKREKDKKKTMERLLKKQDTKSGKNVKNKQLKATVPMIIYRNTIDGATITFPPNMECPLQARTKIEPPKPILCALCDKVKKYNCSKTNLPLCSFKCYKMNVASLKEIIC